ncbi:MAG: hypothetical protein AB7T06_06510 [Kofleriaceae bacterium]
MRHALSLAVSIFALAACSGTQDTTQLRGALDASRISLSDSVSITEASMTAGRATAAHLQPGTAATFRVLAIGGGAGALVHVDLEGAIRSSTPASTTDACPDSISLAQAIAIAEAHAHGTAVAIEPDDDGPCNREVQVLRADDVLWEVKVGPTGTVVESELSDETED